MLLRLYSVIILAFDVTTLLIGIWFSILMAFFRTLRPPSMKSLHGEVVMVVGAGRGVGRDLAIQLSQLGATLACVDISEDNCQGTVQRASLYSGIVKSYVCDVTDQKQVINALQAIRTDLGEVTMLFHCCGVPSPRALIQDPVDVRQIMEVSVMSHFWLLDSILPGMQRIGKGHIIILSSVAGLSSGTSRDARIPLSTAQFAVQGLAESLHSELRHAKSNILITLVHVYPFIIGAEAAKDIRFRIPSYFGTIPSSEAARRILDGVRRNYAEFSVPGYLLYLGHILRYTFKPYYTIGANKNLKRSTFRILPKKASFMLRDLLDTGVDFG